MRQFQAHQVWQAPPVVCGQYGDAQLCTASPVYRVQAVTAPHRPRDAFVPSSRPKKLPLPFSQPAALLRNQKSPPATGIRLHSSAVSTVAELRAQSATLTRALSKRALRPPTPSLPRHALVLEAGCEGTPHVASSFAEPAVAHIDAGFTAANGLNAAPSGGEDAPLSLAVASTSRPRSAPTPSHLTTINGKAHYYLTTGIDPNEGVLSPSARQAQLRRRKLEEARRAASREEHAKAVWARVLREGRPPLQKHRGGVPPAAATGRPGDPPGCRGENAAKAQEQMPGDEASPSSQGIDGTARLEGTLFAVRMDAFSLYQSFQKSSPDQQR
jgi:hypothetical protein